MKNGWYDRLVEIIEADPREYKAISQAAGLGQNYVQQMIKDGKDPTLGKFLSIMHVLGDHHASYIITGLRKGEAQPTDAALRSAMLAYGVDRGDLDPVFAMIHGLMAARGVSPPQPSQPHDQSEPANRHRVSAP
jgi:hypothetical protein